MTGRLAAVVERERAEAAIDALASEGVYDDTRSVDTYGEGVAIPITAPPTETSVIEVVELNLPARNRGLRELLASRGWTDAELDRLPASWAVIGDCVLVQATDDEGGEDENDDKGQDSEIQDEEWDEAPFPRPTEVGEALLELHGGADTVLLARAVSGPHREPDVTVVVGVGDTEVVHTEHGTRYALDLAETMFSPGNQAERVRMGEVVTADERVFDMFAGIGYFTLPMARAGAAVTAAEINPGAYRYLVENAVLNGVESRVSAVRADCRDVDATAERVVMGHYEATDYLDAALDALDPGGVVHVHDAVPEAELWDRPVGAIEATAADRERAVQVLDRRVVKSHAPGVDHVVVDARID